MCFRKENVPTNELNFFLKILRKNTYKASMSIAPAGFFMCGPFGGSPSAINLDYGQTEQHSDAAFEGEELPPTLCSPEDIGVVSSQQRGML